MNLSSSHPSRPLVLFVRSTIFLRRLFYFLLSLSKEHALLSWDGNLVHWFSPFLNRLDNKKQQQMCLLYYAGLIDPDARKSMELIAARGMAFCNWRERG